MAKSNRPSDSVTPDSSKWLVILISVVTIPVIAYCCAIPFMKRSGPDFPGAIVLFTTAFYSSLVGFWAGLGQKWWRWPSVLLVIPVLALVCSLGLQEPYSPFVLFVVSIITIVIVPTLILRIVKGQLRNVSEDVDYVEGLQFGIKDVMNWTVATAVLCTLIRFLSEFELLDWNLPAAVISIIAGLAGSLAINAVVIIWALFGKRITLLKVFVLLALAVLGSIAVMQVARSWLHGWFFIGILLSNQSMLLATMFGVRKLGYRFVRNRA